MKTRFQSLMTLGLLLVASTSLAQVSSEQAAAGPAEEAKRRDQLRVAVQAICPVSGEKLGSMGDPLKVQVGEETLFLCCQGCVNQSIKPEHWKTIHTNVAKAQGSCPVMGHDLPTKPKWTIVAGQVVYVCCPPCTKKITADPTKYLRDVDALYVASLKKSTP